MTQRTQFARSYADGDTFAGQPEGTPYFNFANYRLQIQGPTGVLDLGPLRTFVDTASYVGGDLVYHEGGLYKASGAVSPGAFDPADWQSLVSDPTDFATGSVDWDFTLTYTSNDLVDSVIYSLGQLQVRITLGYTADELTDTVTYERSDDGGSTWGTPDILTLTYDPTTELVTAGNWS